jgi:hypothetical protein
MFTSSLEITSDLVSPVLFDHLTLPALHTLHYIDKSLSLRDLNPFVIRSACPLRTLELLLGSDPIIIYQLLEVLQAVPSFVQLILQCETPFKPQACRGSRHARLSCFVPNLGVLRIFGPFQLDEAFTNMVQSRWRLHRDSHHLEAASGQIGMVARLATIEIHLLISVPPNKWLPD